MKRLQRGTRKSKLKGWVKRSRQKGGFIIAGLIAIGSAIAAALTAAAPAIATGTITAAAGYATKKVLEKSFGAGKRGKRIRRIQRK